MECINDWILVAFDMNHNKKFGDFIRPDQWLFEEVNGVQKWDENRDKKQTNPQIATVISENPKFPVKKGEKIFVHYLAIDTGSELEYEGQLCHFIKKSQVFLKIEQDGSYTMMPNTFLGEQVYTEGVKTDSGIYLVPWAEKKEALQVKITHAPKDRFFKEGDIIISYDDNQYELEVDGKKYIKITSEWMTCKLVNNKIVEV